MAGSPATEDSQLAHVSWGQRESTGLEAWGSAVWVLSPPRWARGRYWKEELHESYFLKVPGVRLLTGDVLDAWLRRGERREMQQTSLSQEHTMTCVWSQWIHVL